jgi:hypothetical protein
LHVCLCIGYPSVRAVKTIEEFIARYAPTPPRRQRANDDEARLLEVDDGVLSLDSAPAQTDAPGVPDDRDTRHLWVIWPIGIPYILERAPRVRAPLESGVAKHSNLTGGQAASCGGELWVDSINPSKLYINGASGRYGPRTPAQLEDAAHVLRARGFEVESFGWDADTNLPARVLRR